MPFITDDFLLHCEPAKRLYHEYAAVMPVYDFHCHLDPAAIRDNNRFSNMTDAWLRSDHYKWRAMRALGIPENEITGNATDREKFDAWARTIPYCIGNPLYHWTHLELSRIFKTDAVLSPDIANEIFQYCNLLLATDDFSVRKLLLRMNVRVVCTTDDPTDSLESHRKLAEDGSFPIRVLPTFRPDKARAIASTGPFNEWIDKLEQATDITIADSAAFIEAIKKRHDYFHGIGCRLSDHGMGTPCSQPYSEKEVDAIFKKARARHDVSPDESLQFQSFVLSECAKMDAEKGWAMQLHIGALRNNNSARFRAIGPDTGFDSISDEPVTQSLGRFLDSLENENRLPKTIVYTLDPSKNEAIETMIGNFQSDSARGKMQLGAAWWFNDFKDGIERHLKTVAGMGLLAPFIGMSTDSRSFLSFPRHEYFRRILCNMLGSEIAAGELPNDIPFIGRIVEDICYNNAKNYFNIGLRAPESEEKRRS